MRTYHRKRWPGVTVDQRRDLPLRYRPSDVLGRELYDILVGIGGWVALIPPIEPDSTILVSHRAQIWDGKRASLWGGIPCECHRNAAWLYKHEGLKIVTGYAMSDDGIWRQHSWALESHRRLIETTVGRVVYYGYVLTQEEAKEFVEQNLFRKYP